MCPIIKDKVDVHKEDTTAGIKSTPRPTFSALSVKNPALSAKILLKTARLLSQRLHQTSGQL